MPDIELTVTVNNRKVVTAGSVGISISSKQIEITTPDGRSPFQELLAGDTQIVVESSGLLYLSAGNKSPSLVRSVTFNLSEAPTTNHAARIAGGKIESGYMRLHIDLSRLHRRNFRIST